MKAKILFLVAFIISSQSFAYEIERSNVDKLQCQTATGLSVALKGQPSAENPATIRYLGISKPFHVAMISGEYDSTKKSELYVQLVDSATMMTGVITSYALELKGKKTDGDNFMLNGIISKSVTNVLFPVPVQVFFLPVSCELSLR